MQRARRVSEPSYRLTRRLLTAYCLLLTAYHLPLTTYHLPLTTYYLLLTSYNPLITSYYLLLTTDYLLPTPDLFDRIIAAKERRAMQRPISREEFEFAQSLFQARGRLKLRVRVKGAREREG